MPLLMNNELARRENGKVEVRGGPVRVRWNLDDLVTSDGHKLHCAFTCSATALGDATERRMLEEVFLGRGQAVTTDAVVAHFAPALRAAAGKVAGKHTAAEWVEGDLKQPMIDGLCEAARRVAFSAGLEILAPAVGWRWERRWQNGPPVPSRRSSLGHFRNKSPPPSSGHRHPG